jgi:xylulokinase
VHGAADTAAALLVAGGRMLNVGTGAQLAQPVDEPLPRTPAPTCHRFRAAGRGWYALAAVQNAGLAVDWARGVLGPAEPAPGEALFVPHLTGARTPLLDPSARGAWTGLSLATTRGELLGSVLEGVAFAVRWARDALVAEAGRMTFPPTPLRLLGGGSLDPALAQLLADALAEPLELLDVADASALGAARLAGAPGTRARVTGTVEPRAAAPLEERYAAWLGVVEML